MKQKLCLAVLIVIVSYFAIITSELFASQPTLAVVDANYSVRGDTTYRTLVNDTCGGTDSATLFTKKGFLDLDDGTQYILMNEAIAGSGDSVALQVVIDSYVDSTTVAKRHIIDTISGEDPEYYLLPFGGTVFGRKFTLKVIGITGNGTTVVLSKFHLFKRRVETKAIGVFK